MCVKPHTSAEAETYHSIEHLTGRIDAGETSAQVYFQRGRAYKQIAYLSEAIADLTRALEGAPQLSREDQAIAYDLRGMAHRRLGNFSDAISDGTRALQLDPNQAPFWADRGWAYSAFGQMDLAMADFEHCLDLHPYFLAFIYRGMTHFVMGNHQAALDDYNQVIDLYPNDIAFNSYLNRAILRLLVHRDCSGAEADLNVAVVRNPDAVKPSPRPHAYRGLVRALQGRMDEALADLEAGQAFGNDLMFPLARGYVLQQRGNSVAVQEEMMEFMHQSSENGMEVGYSLRILSGFLENPLSVIPQLIPLVA